MSAYTLYKVYADMHALIERIRTDIRHACLHIRSIKACMPAYTFYKVYADMHAFIERICRHACLNRTYFARTWVRYICS